MPAISRAAARRLIAWRITIGRKGCASAQHWRCRSLGHSQSKFTASLATTVIATTTSTRLGSPGSTAGAAACEGGRELIASATRVRQQVRPAERILLARGELPRQQKRELVLPSAAPPRSQFWRSHPNVRGGNLNRSNLRRVQSPRSSRQSPVGAASRRRRFCPPAPFVSPQI